jgi:hypothetical protein
MLKWKNKYPDDKNRLPEDILNLIFEMNPEHREKFKMVIMQIKLNGLTNALKKIGVSYRTIYFVRSL